MVCVRVLAPTETEIVDVDNFGIIYPLVCLSSLYKAAQPRYGVTSDLRTFILSPMTKL